MARGKAQNINLGSGGLIRISDQPDWGFIYETSTVRNSKFNIGDKVELPDGRIFRYGLSTGVLKAEMGCKFTDAGIVPFTSFTTAAAVAAKTISCPAATHVSQAKDQLRGGYVVIFLAGAVQFRGIVGNDATAADVAFNIYLDGALSVAVSTSSAVEVYGNPYRFLDSNMDPNGNGFAGAPAVAVSAAAMYFWVQTNGPIFLNPQSTLTATKEATMGCFRHDGSLEAIATALGATIPTYDTSQIAGYRMAGSYSGNGPLFMLQG